MLNFLINFKSTSTSILYEAFTGSISFSSAAWGILNILNPAADIKAAVSLVANLIDNIRLALGGNASLWQIVKMIPDFAMTIVGLIPGVKVLDVIANAYSIGNLL